MIFINELGELVHIDCADNVTHIDGFIFENMWNFFIKN